MKHRCTVIRPWAIMFDIQHIKEPKVRMEVSCTPLGHKLLLQLLCFTRSFNQCQESQKPQPFSADSANQTIRKSQVSKQPFASAVKMMALPCEEDQNSMLIPRSQVRSSLLRFYAHVIRFCYYL